ncbi:hypothetical protein M422DRAFT_252919 [Sphaerobolus stellatus SS14]|uniref:Uncharacterized protein n=1 Tax=Sphaerobolus stellatus (strain SS14) TaxID=990650 RepID=A0A0C9V9M1_SPHS4|nr:hypothetical protein M422DRAFT_252919 [Sphaerobolus stellatus SS14]
MAYDVDVDVVWEQDEGNPEIRPAPIESDRADLAGVPAINHFVYYSILLPLKRHLLPAPSDSSDKYENTTDPERYRKPPKEHVLGTSSINPINVSLQDAVEYLRKLLPLLEFPEDVAQCMTTHVSWQRGTEGHNGRLSFIGGGSDKKSKKSYDEISRKMLDTYLLGEHVGGAWQLEHIMRWTPAIPELDILKVETPGRILHSSGLYKVRGTMVQRLWEASSINFTLVYRKLCVKRWSRFLTVLEVLTTY